MKELDSSFLEVALVDIDRALKENTNLAVFILGVCMIDALAGFYCGKEKPTSEGNTDRFKIFVGKYLYQSIAYWIFRVRLLKKRMMTDFIHSGNPSNKRGSGFPQLLGMIECIAMMRFFLQWGILVL